MNRKALFVLALSTVAAASQAVVLNEIFINPPGTDNGLEFFELRGNANESLDGLTLLVLEGDGTASGVIDAAYSLSGTLGANGLFVRRDASANIKWRNAQNAWAIENAPLANTTVQVADFNPDIENGSNTYILVSGFTGTVATDLDTNNDGVLDSTPWASVTDAVGLIENDGADNRAYATGLGFYDFGPQTAFNADVLFRAYNAGTNSPMWFGSDVVADAGDGTFEVDPTRYASQFGLSASAAQEIADANKWTLTPGGENPTVPEPATMIALGAGALGLIRKRRNK